APPRSSRPGFPGPATGTAPRRRAGPAPSGRGSGPTGGSPRGAASPLRRPSGARPPRRPRGRASSRLPGPPGLPEALLRTWEVTAASALGAAALGVAPGEPLDSTGGVDQLLLAGEEGVALGADFQPEVLLGAAGDKGLAAGTDHGDLLIIGVNLS